MDAVDLLKTSDVELLHRADACLRQAGSALDTPPPYIDDAVRLRVFLEAHSYLSEILRRRAEKAAAHDRTREHRRFVTELLVIGGLILVEIGLGVLGLSEGRQQATILEQMNKNTKDTAAQIQRAADAMTQTLQVLQADRADRLAQLNKRPEFAINVGRVPLLKAHATLTPTQETDTNVTYHLDLWNRGDVTANKLYFRALVSARDVTAVSDPPGLIPEPDPTDSSVQAFISPHLFVRSHSYMPFDITFSFQKGHPPFQVTFKADSEEVRTPTFLGVLPVTPRTSSK